MMQRHAFVLARHEDQPSAPVAEYRWNVDDFAKGYDAAAEHIHPHYLELQNLLLDLVPIPRHEAFLWVDAGGGSGRLAARFLDRFSFAQAVVVDQSEAFLSLARRRLKPHGDRARCLGARLQEPWEQDLPIAPRAIVSMSAIHHLDPAEKRSLYARCCRALEPGGVFINADEVRPADDAEYLNRCRAWVDHMNRVMADGLVSEPMCENLRKWEERNVTKFGQPRASGDDCHETVDAQLEYLRQGGFRAADCPWQRTMWAVLRAVK